jgi:hypothetical protein
MNLILRFTLWASASAVQICSRQICRCVAAFLQLELFRVYIPVILQAAGVLAATVITIPALFAALE